MKKVPGGEQELALLRFVAQHGPLTVGQAAEQFGLEHGLARSTVLTMMERLRAKGHLARRRTEGVYRYASRLGHEELLRDLVGQFVQRSLNGSVSPFVSWLAESSEVNEEELSRLEALVARLREEKTAPGRKGGDE